MGVRGAPTQTDIFIISRVKAVCLSYLAIFDTDSSIQKFTLVKNSIYLFMKVAYNWVNS